jgi:HEAT repeat protein
MIRHQYLATVLATLVATGTLTAEEFPRNPDEAQLQAALLPTDNEGLVQFLALRARGDCSAEALGRMLEMLHSPMPEARQQACAELVTLGTPSLPGLRALTRTMDSLAAPLAQRCLQTIETDRGNLTVAVVRLLAQRRPVGTASVLLAYLPHAENETVLEAVQTALQTVTYDDWNVVTPSVDKALSSRHPLLRATAIAVLGEKPPAASRNQIRKLLKDPVPIVRLHAALALAQAGEAEAIPTLIALLGQASDKRARDLSLDFLTDLAGTLGPKINPGEDEASRQQAWEAWARWWDDSGRMDLLDELKKRTLSEANITRMQALTSKLSDEDFQVREDAEKQLLALGESLLPLLKRAAQNQSDLEIRLRILRCAGQLEKAKARSSTLLPTIARLIALRKPPGAATVILAYLPFMDTDGPLDEFQHALNLVATADGKVPPVLLTALTDTQGIRRAAAAQAICAATGTEHGEAVRRLLNDPIPGVRLKAALALASAGDRTAVPALITLLSRLSVEERGQAEEYLNTLAGANGPTDLPQGESTESREKRSALWSAWWQANKNQVVLANCPGSLFGSLISTTGEKWVRGHKLLVQTQANTVTELNKDEKPIWTLSGLANPRDAQLLSGRRILLVEQNQVSERNLQGMILWQKPLAGPRSAQRLRNGNTFIVCANQLIELNRSAEEVCRIDLPAVDAARKLPNGEIVAFNRNEVLKLDKSGKILVTTPVDCGGAGCNEVLDNGHVLVSSPGNGNLIEFDADGQEVNRFNMPGVVHGYRLSNGHTLVTINGGRCVELDAQWQPVKEIELPGPAFRVKVR